MFLVKDESSQGHWVHFNIQNREHSLEKAKHREEHKIESVFCDGERDHSQAVGAGAEFLFIFYFGKSFSRSTHCFFCPIFMCSGEHVQITYETLSTSPRANPGPSYSFQFGHHLALPGSRTGPGQASFYSLIHSFSRNLASWSLPPE